MKRVLKYILVSVVILAAALIMAYAHLESGKSHSVLICKGIKVDIADSTELQFVRAKDIKRFVTEDYGKCTGDRADKIPVSRIEKSVSARGAIRKCEAWITKDGYLHLSIQQREPVVRFQHGSSGYYSDENGFIFPLQSNYTSRVPIVDGNIPLNIAPGYRGAPESRKEREWLAEVIGFVGWLDEHRNRADFTGQMHIDNEGNLLIVPREGQEMFVFGKFTDFDEKFKRIDNYYKYIRPSREEGREYKRIDVRYFGQIVCK